MAIDACEQPPAGHIVLTYEDYCALADDGKRHEILDGEVYIMPSPFEPGRGGYRRAARLSGEDFVPTLFSGPTIRLATPWS